MANEDVKSPVTGSVWKVECEEGQSVQAGDVLIILESMKMEIPVEAPSAGKVASLAVKPEESVEEDQLLCTIET